MKETKRVIEAGKAVLGIELGSTRIKAVLIGEDHKPIASGSHSWENRLENGVWTYSMEDIWKGLQDCYQDLASDVKKTYGLELTRVGAIGISAMMHGYMAFDEKGELLAPFRTWRNTLAGRAAAELTELFQYNIPERWSISHLYHSILNKEAHVPQITYLTTLAGYIHWQLTGRKVLGVGDASGMFPIDPETGTYRMDLVEKFDAEVAPCGFSWKLTDILPRVLSAGEAAGVLTDTGAKLLDVSGKLQSGIPLCPPEGDGGTGMVATNSVARRTGNVSAGTSIFVMAVMEKELKKLHREIDLVTTPDGSLVAMVHANNCTSDLNAWVGLFGEFAEAAGMKLDANELFGLLYNKALEGDADCGGLVSYGYYSGEFITGMEEGRPLFVRKPDARFDLANFMRTHLFAALAVVRMGMDILSGEEEVELDSLMGHGGLFKTRGVGQRMMAAAMKTPVVVMETAGEGGAWGVALLAAYLKNRAEGESLADYLNNRVFAGSEGSCLEPDEGDVKGFEAFMELYKAGLAAERGAVDSLR